MNTFTLLLAAAVTGLISLPAIAADLPIWQLTVIPAVTFGLLMLFILEFNTGRPASLRERPVRVSAPARRRAPAPLALPFPAEA
ncbi:MAG: hypothetical protein EA425_05810 [Puniceicoccaceae bacterium]|nr:MAG: hypothetical protein EA425_05810 [Puniceicoccaceae bacterium]